MTNNNLVVKKQDPLVEFDGERYSKMIGRLRNMIVGGKKLKDHEVEALAGASLATGLNPFAKEIYFVPGVGPEIGKQGYARKAQEQLEYEAERSGYRNPVTISVKTRPATREEVGAEIKEGDVAIHVTLTDSLTKSEWLGKLMEFKEDFGPDMALQVVGEQPSWTGVGVVYATENFGKDLYARAERAEKRATKQAMLKRFPRLELPDLTRVMAELPKHSLEMVEEENPHVGRPADDIIEDLYGPEPGKRVQKVTREDVAEAEEEDTVEGEAREVSDWPEETVKAIIKARYIKEPGHVVEVLNLSEFLTPELGQKKAVMWASWYTETRQKGLEPEGAAGAADQNLADLLSAEEE